MRVAETVKELTLPITGVVAARAEAIALAIVLSRQLDVEIVDDAAATVDMLRVDMATDVADIVTRLEQLRVAGVVGRVLLLLGSGAGLVGTFGAVVKRGNVAVLGVTHVVHPAATMAIIIELGTSVDAVVVADGLLMLERAAAWHMSDELAAARKELARRERRISWLTAELDEATVIVERERAIYERSLARVESRLETLRDRLAAVRGSMSYRLGHALALAVRRPKSLLMLPRKVLRRVGR